MKAKIIVTPKKAVLDPQGKTVQNALAHMGYDGIGDVHVGKYLEIELAGSDKAGWHKQIDDQNRSDQKNQRIKAYQSNCLVDVPYASPERPLWFGCLHHIALLHAALTSACGFNPPLDNHRNSVRSTPRNTRCPHDRP